MKTRHRDSIYKLYGRVCDTISVFCYQGAIFYVQMTVFNHQFICNEKGDCKLSPPENAIMAWLYIEIFCFYLYMISACLYIAFHQLVESPHHGAASMPAQRGLGITIMARGIAACRMGE